MPNIHDSKNKIGNRIITKENIKRSLSEFVLPRNLEFKIDLIEGTIFKSGEKMSIFVTDDENKIPIYVEAEILIGAIQVFVNTIKNSKTTIKYLQ